MRLVRDHSLAAGNVSVQCLECGRMGTLASMLIDRDGPAFQAYYHDSVECLSNLSPQALDLASRLKCDDNGRRGCRRFPCGGAA